MNKGNKLLQKQRISNDGVAFILENDFIVMTYNSHVIYQRKLVTAPHALHVTPSGDFVAITSQGEVLETFARGGDKFMVGQSGLGMFVKSATKTDPQKILFRTTGSNVAKDILEPPRSTPLQGQVSFTLAKGQSIPDKGGLETSTSQLRYNATKGLTISYKRYVVDQLTKKSSSGSTLTLTNDGKFVIVDKKGKHVHTLASNMDSIELSPVGDLIGTVSGTGVKISIRSSGTALHRTVESILEMTSARAQRLASPPAPQTPETPPTTPPVSSTQAPPVLQTPPAPPLSSTSFPDSLPLTAPNQVTSSSNTSTSLLPSEVLSLVTNNQISSSDLLVSTPSNQPQVFNQATSQTTIIRDPQFPPTTASNVADAGTVAVASQQNGTNQENSADAKDSSSEAASKRANVALIVVGSILASICVAGAVMYFYKKRKSSKD